jgi:predicted phosphohydrolase
MSIYAISDLHLSNGVNKPMDIFGEQWEGYMEKIRANWTDCVGRDDWVLVAGDISWASSLDEAMPDFEYLSALPGKKILLKGNHDYWWTTLNKMNGFKEAKGLRDIFFLHNNSYICDGIAVCGTRGWVSPGSQEFTEHDMKIYNRELGRLEISLKSALGSGCEQVVVMMHYPPVYQNGSNAFLEILKRFGVKKCIYGHLHGTAFKDAFEGIIDGVEITITSCDYLGFKPVRLF